MEEDLYRLIKVKHKFHPNLESIRTNAELWDETLSQALGEGWYHIDGPGKAWSRTPGP